MSLRYWLPCVFLLCLLGVWTRSQMNSVSTSPKPLVAALVAEPNVIEARFGVNKTSHSLRLRNSGAVPVRIVEITTTCGCTLVGDVPAKAIAPGEECVVEVRATPAEFGEKISHLSIRTDPVLVKPLVVTVKLTGQEIPAPFVSFTPEVVTLSGTEPLCVTTSEFEVHTVELAQSSFFLRRLQSNVDGLRIWFEEDPREEPFFDGKVRRIYTLKVSRRLPESDVEVARHRHLIATESGDSRPTRAVTIESRVTPLMRIVPSVVNLTLRQDDRSSVESVVVVIDSRVETERSQLLPRVEIAKGAEREWCYQTRHGEIQGQGLA